MCAKHTTGTGSLFEWPANPIGYVAIIMALITGVLHLIASTNAIEMSEILALLFILNGLGFIGGAILYVTRYWQPWLFLVAAIYSIVTILALFPVQGWGVEAFYMQGSINPIAVITKAAEAILAVCALYLYAGTR
ncbi:uncharacterized protein Nmag_4062 (plasmid) [Natrialba magadii ATCC 43099]|uniref:Uncharacterized protein n=1 Tax=Natrialba magadii (strain ATCC 43099 / DSM 3394 / CCM 3739 / CIP 104546 / IAM 13178 / JCM 8861 / NBRC 102185 / NCIMB 2190 / MS3) TaxID=547559 RepID=D3T1X9_NATMM|nr:hypothetical protein [Natrialba magadii]ADD07588.1 uncharacterized protein Nmag_4062 [Natrialba magadii ATCC 43099]ELY27065.1 hypothetical protein C500_14545 [Natrialba magadii ATCC 43099]